MLYFLYFLSVITSLNNNFTIKKIHDDENILTTLYHMKMNYM